MRVDPAALENGIALRNFLGLYGLDIGVVSNAAGFAEHSPEAHGVLMGLFGARMCSWNKTGDQMTIIVNNHIQIAKCSWTMVEWVEGLRDWHRQDST